MGDSGFLQQKLNELKTCGLITIEMRVHRSYLQGNIRLNVESEQIMEALEADSQLGHLVQCLRP